MVDENAFDLIAGWMRGRGILVPPRALTVADLLESIVEQTSEEARQSGCETGYEMAKENYQEDQS